MCLFVDASWFLCICLRYQNATATCVWFWWCKVWHRRKRIDILMNVISCFFGGIINSCVRFYNTCSIEQFLCLKSGDIWRWKQDLRALHELVVCFSQPHTLKWISLACTKVIAGLHLQGSSSMNHTDILKKIQLGISNFDIEILLSWNTNSVPTNTR